MINPFAALRVSLLALGAGAAVFLVMSAVRPSSAAAGGTHVVLAAAAEAAPAFTHGDAASWINSSPLTWSALRGKVVLIDVWTFECWNCYRSFPWLHGVEQRFATSGLQVVGVHSPEFDAEKVRASIEAATKKFDVKFPVMIDNDHSYWNALDNSYWPAFYLVDRQGRIRGRYVGETHDGDINAQHIEADLEKLLAEPVAG